MAADYSTEPFDDLNQGREQSSRGKQPARLDPPTGWGWVLLGILPFLLFGLAYLVQAVHELGGLASWPPGLVRTAPLIAYGALSLVLALGWLFGLPRWSLPYLGIGLYFGSYYSDVTIYGQRYGFQGWLPFLTGLVVGLLVSRSLVPFFHLFRSIWRDWTRLSLGIYAYLIPLMSIVFTDSDYGYREVYGLVFDTLLLAAGAALYLRSRSTWKKVASLEAAMLLLLLRNVLMGDWYGGPANLGSINLLGWVYIVLIWGGLMFLPASQIGPSGPRSPSRWPRPPS